MKRPSKWWLLLLIPLILVLLPLGFLYLTQFDDRAKIARTLLYERDGGLDKRTFTAAINARFPKGASSRELTEFVKAIGGDCRPAENGRLSCSVAESGIFCVATRIGLSVYLGASGQVESISAEEYSIGC